MMTLSDFAAKHKVTRSWVHQCLQAGRIKGAKLIGNGNSRGVWIIPPNAKIGPLKKTA